MYIGTNDSNGTIWTVELDAELNPVGEPSLWNSGLGGWHDGLGVDICGNVYLADYDTLSLYRLSPDGAKVETLVDGDTNPSMYGHGLVWGSGIGGWKERSLYLPQPRNGDTLAELDIEVPYRTWQGTGINKQ